MTKAYSKNKHNVHTQLQTESWKRLLFSSQDSCKIICILSEVPALDSLHYLQPHKKPWTMLLTYSKASLQAESMFLNKCHNSFINYFQGDKNSG